MNKFRAYLIQEEKSELAKGEQILRDVVNYGMMEKIVHLYSNILFGLNYLSSL